jgi:hypothetical protein
MPGPPRLCDQAICPNGVPTRISAAAAALAPAIAFANKCLNRMSYPSFGVPPPNRVVPLEIIVALLAQRVDQAIAVRRRNETLIPH